MGNSWAKNIFICNTISVLTSENQQLKVILHNTVSSLEPYLLIITFSETIFIFLSLQSPHGVPVRNSGSPKFAMKTRQAFYLHTTKLTRIARRLCRDILRPWHAARHPYLPINSAAIKAECECAAAGTSLPRSPLRLLSYKVLSCSLLRCSLTHSQCFHKIQLYLQSLLTDGRLSKITLEVHELFVLKHLCLLLHGAFSLFVSYCQDLLATCKIPFNGKVLSGHWSYLLGFAIIAKFFTL